MKEVINSKHLINEPKEKLENSFCIVYADTNSIFILDGQGLNEEDRIAKVNEFICECTQGCNYSRAIIAKSGNIYFVY